jgi:hypothetical protein
MASKVCSVVFGTVVVTLGCTILHAIFRPLHSLFASTLTNLIIEGYMCGLRRLYYGLVALHWGLPTCALRRHVGSVSDGIYSHIMHLRAYRNVSNIQIHHVKAYHSIMSQTYDDSLLDDGSSALKAVLQVTPSLKEKALASSMMELVAYLFSPVASRRSAMTAARAIHDYKPSRPGKQIYQRTDKVALGFCDDV